MSDRCDEGNVTRCKGLKQRLDTCPMWAVRRDNTSLGDFLTRMLLACRGETNMVVFDCYRLCESVT